MIPIQPPASRVLFLLLDFELDLALPISPAFVQRLGLDFRRRSSPNGSVFP